MLEIITLVKTFFLTFFSGGLMAVGLKIAALATLLWFLWYLFFAEKNYKNPIWALIVVVLGGLIFAGFIVGGVKGGRLFGFDELGAFIGMFAFYVCTRVWTFITTPKSQRNRKVL